MTKTPILLAYALLLGLSVWAVEPLNLGIGGDTTGEVLWRLRYARQLDGYRAKCISLMIGTNNRKAIASGRRSSVRILRRFATRI